MRVHILILTVLFLLAGFINNLTSQSIKSCGHDHAQSDLFETPEDFEKAKSDVLKGAYSKYLRKSGQKNNAAITVPVVFHIIHAGEAEGVGSNLPAGRVQAQLDVLNADFSASNPNFSDVTRTAWDAVKGNPLITFCLATKDPNGATTSGIVRHDIPITGSDANNNNIESVKASIFWDSDDYMNVYVLSIPGTTAFGGVVGYAFLPYFGTVGSAQDGIVVDYNWFGGDGYAQSGVKTLTHEVGHYLGLFHTFNGYDCGADDGLNDTPNMDDATASINPSLSCGNAMNPYPAGPESCGNEHMYINYMDYVNDESCPTSFTIDQVAIMRGVLEGTAPSYASRVPLTANATTACDGAPSCDLSATISHTNATCYDSDDGSATVAPTAGTSPYTYVWSTDPSQSTITATDLAAGTYFVTTTDAVGCTVVNTVIIVAPNELLSNVTASDETSLGAEDGMVSSSPSGGTSGYTYLWDSGLGTLDSYSNLSPGTYNVTVTDNVGCVTTGSGEVAQGPCSDLLVNVSTSDVRCFGESNGIANITVSGGISPYSYSWNGQIFGDARFNLTSQSYTVNVTDNEGCTGSVNFYIGQPSALIVDVSTTDITGVGFNDGTATAAVTGGVTSYQYEWSNGETNTHVIDNLSPGTYTVTITDDNNCTTSDSAQVADFTCTGFDITLSGGELLCADDSSLLSVSNVSSTGPYNYAWSTGENTDVISISTGGTYTVSIQDAYGCVSSESKVIDDAPAGIGLSFASFAESVTDGNNGRIETQVNGGTPGYTFLWSNGATTANLENLPPGNYTVTVSDANNCNEIGTVTVDEFTCTSYQVVLNTQNVTCHNASDGFIDANPSSVTPFSYEWSNGATTKTIDLLNIGTYTVTVTDGNGCISTASSTINQPTAINIDINKFDESALDANDGEINTTVSGGVPAYNYLWSDGSTNVNRTGLAPGTYSLTVNDDTQCNASAIITIAEYNCGAITIAPVVTDISCSGDSSGAIMLNIQVIAAPYSVFWSTSSTAESITGLISGNYAVTLTDAGGCELLRSFTINEPPPLFATTTATAETAYEANDGTATVSAQGGTASYAYLWNNGATSPNIADLTPGNYIVTISDVNGCTYIASTTVSAYVCPPFDIVEMNTTDNACFGNSNGILGASISGGTGPYEFNWSTGATTTVINGLEAGMYSVTVTDAKNCPVIGTASIVDPSELQVTTTISHVSSVGAMDGSVTLAIQGGTEPYTIDWSNGASGVSIENLSEGTYTYIVTDVNGCQVTGDITIDQYVCPNLILTFETTNISCNGEVDGELKAIPSEGTGPYNFMWSTNATDDTIIELPKGTYEVTATDSRGCTIIGSDSIVEPAILSYSEEVTHESGGNMNDGTISLNITGGSAPYEVNWTDGETGAERLWMSPGVYGFVVVDINRCTISGEFTVTEFDCPDISLTIAVFNNECEDGDVGGVDAVVTNGTEPYSYTVDGVLQEGASIRGLPAGSYDIVVADANGCSASASFEVETPMMMVIDGLTSDDTSGLLPGSATVTVIGGTEPYIYLWSDGRTNATNNALFPGIHQVSITDTLGCVVEQDVIIRKIEDIGSISDLQLFETHPNPATEVINIQFEFSIAKDIRVTITNLSGQPLFDEVLNTEVYDKEIDISRFPKGMYTINVYSEQEVITKPLAIF